MEQPKREKLLKADEVVSKNGSNKTLWIIILIVAGFYVGSKFNSLDEAWLYTLNTLSKYVDEKPTENKTIVKENIENTNIQTSIKEEIQKNVATPPIKQEDVDESSCEKTTPSDNTINTFANNYGIVIDAKNSSVVMGSDTVKINYKNLYDYSFSVTLDYKDMDSETKEAAKVVLDFCYWIIKGENRDRSLGKWYFHEDRLSPEAKMGIINAEFENKLPHGDEYESGDIYANDLECPQNWLIKRYEKKDDLITFNIDIVADDECYKPNIYFVCKKINNKYKIVEFNNICSKDYNRIKIGSDVNIARILFESPLKENSTELYYSPTDRIWLKDRKIVGWYGFEEFSNYFENWQEVQSSNNPAGALDNYRDPEFAKSGIVNAKSGINLRKEPTTKSEKTGKFENNRKVLVLDKSGPSEIIENKKSNWYYITDGEQSGWCFGGFVQIEAQCCYGLAGYWIGNKLDASKVERKDKNTYFTWNFDIHDFYIEPKFDKIIVFTDDNDYIGMVGVSKSFDSYEEAAAYYRRLINIVENHYELSHLKVSENKESSSSYFIVDSFSGDHRMISINNDGLNNGGQEVSLLIISYKYNEKSKEEAKQKRLKAYGKKKIKQGVDRGIYSNIKMAKKKEVCIEHVKDYDILEIIDDTKEFFIVKNLRTGCVGYVHPNNLEDAYTAIEIIRKNVFPNDNGMCTGLGGYYLGDICKTNLNQDQLHESSFWISVEQFTPVLSFTKGALLKITPKTNRIVGIKLLSQFGEYDRHLSYMSITRSYLGGYRRDPNTVNDTAEILERHYNVRKKPKGKDLWEIVFANNVILTLEKYGEYGQWSLYCYSPVFDNANEEWDSIINERQQKAKVNRQKQLESMGKTGLN